MNIYESIAAIMQEIPAIGKDKKNQQQGFKYRGIDDVMNALQPILSKYRVFVVPEVLAQSREERKNSKGGTLMYSIMQIKYSFFAEDGTSVSAVVVGEGMDSGDKASNKAMSVALKYAFFQVFCIPTEEMNDPDADFPEPGDPIVKCEKCGEEITPVKKHDGSMWEVSDMCKYSKKNFKAKLCGPCMKEAERKKKANAG